MPNNQFVFPAILPCGPVTYYLWSDGDCIGYRCVHQDGRTTYLYFHASEPDSDPDEETSVFLYQGTEGDPAHDTPQFYLVPFPAASTAETDEETDITPRSF